MPTRNPSINHTQFQGLRVNSNPLGDTARPETSATTFHNMRLLRGSGWMRLFGGRKVQWFNPTANALITRIHEFKDLTYTGFNLHMFQEVVAGVAKWQWKNITNWTSADVLTINNTLDTSFAATNQAAIVNLRDRVVMYNGLGVRDVTNSRPAFTNWTASVGYPYYFGLDAYVPGPPPNIGSLGAGTITIQAGRRLGVGLHNTVTGHFSNAYDLGELAPGVNVSELTISNCQRLSTAIHALAGGGTNASERDALMLVPYVSVDGGALLHPVVDPATNTYLMFSHNLVTTVGVNGWPVGQIRISATQEANIDLTKEGPRFNHPPRPMRWLALVQGILYGGLLKGGADTTPTNLDGFSYVPTIWQRTGVAYSAVATDDNEILGVPEECWPPDHVTYPPNAEVPLIGLAIPEDYRLFVITPTSCFVVTRATDGIHDWTEVKGRHGISNPATAVSTRHGICWRDQRGQKCRLVPNEYGGTVDILSQEYDQLFIRKTARSATYTYDPYNSIDRYEVMYDDGTGSYHDFASGEGGSFDIDMQCGADVTALDGKVYHLLAKRHIYSQAGQPANSDREQFPNQDYGATALDIVSTPIVGVRTTQYMAFGEEEGRKPVKVVRVYGDGDNVTVTCTRDFADLTVAANSEQLEPIPQEEEDLTYIRRFRVAMTEMANLWRFTFTLVGPAAGDHIAVESYGTAKRSLNFRGIIMRIGYLVGAIRDRGDA